MAKLIVRNVASDLVKALELRAAGNGRSVEEEHREILKEALRGLRRRPLPEVLASMPNVGRDSDFSRRQANRRT